MPFSPYLGEVCLRQVKLLCSEVFRRKVMFAVPARGFPLLNSGRKNFVRLRFPLVLSFLVKGKNIVSLSLPLPLSSVTHLITYRFIKERN